MPAGALGDRPGDVDRPRFVDVVVDVAQRLELAVEQDRLFEQQLVRVLGRLVEQVALVAQAGREAHHDFLADRVDRRVGDLREELLEVGEQRRRLVGEHRQREVVAHRADRLGAVDRHRRQQHPQVLLGVAEGALAQPQRLVGERHFVRGRQVREGHGVARVPLAVGLARGDLALDLLVLDDPAPLEVDEEQLARLQAPEAPDLLGRDVEQARPPSRARRGRRSSPPSGPGRRPLRSSVAPTTRPSVKATEAGPSQGSIRQEWKA